MAHPLYPIFLRLDGKRVLLIACGKTAQRKGKTLARSGALVKTVAPSRFHETDLRGAALVVAATQDEELNRKISQLCRRRGKWANIVDRPLLCDFFSPAVARRGRVTVAVSTGGASPALAARLKRRLQSQLTSKVARLAERLARMRPALLRLGMPRRRRLLKGLLARV